MKKAFVDTKPVVKPSTFYKFMNVSEEQFQKVKESLLEKKIWYSKLMNLNDPLEGSLACYTMPHIIANFIERKFSKIAVSCFTENRDNMAMWSHYAKGGKGICVEYSSNSSCFDEIRPVNYIKHLSEIPFEAAEMKKLVYFKSFNWSYEREWRLVSNEEGYSKPGNFNATKIYVLNQNMSELNPILNIAKDLDIKVYQWNSALTNENLSLIFDQIN